MNKLDAFRREMAAAPAMPDVIRLLQKWRGMVGAEGEMNLLQVLAAESPFVAPVLAQYLANHGAADHLIKNPRAGDADFSAALEVLVRDVNTVAASQLRAFARAGKLPADSEWVTRVCMHAVQFPERSQEVASVLSAIPSLPEGTWREWARDVVAQGGRAPRLLARVKRAPASLGLAVLSTAEWSPDVMGALAEGEAAMSDEDVRAALLTYGRLRDPDVLVSLSRNAAPEELAESFRAALRFHGPESAARVLAVAPEGSWGALKQEDLRPLMENTSQEVRLVAIRASGRATAEDATAKAGILSWLRVR